MPSPQNLLADLPSYMTEEVLQTLLVTPAVRIERIASYGNASPAGFWFDQDMHEWVMLITGAARLQFEGEPPVEMTAGSFINIPAHQRHRVDWTDPDQPTIWLAIHYA
jgi:cupin 2 domain-containing protein